jgi:heme a synthase
MVVVGGITRLTLSGLSITEWKPVIGIVPPLSAADWAAEFARYQQIPEYRAIHFAMSLDEFKSIYYWEYVHRLLGRLIGVAFALPFIWFLARRRLPWRLAPPLAGILLLGFLQGALGWYMVESGLADRVEVSQYRLVAHLALALAIYAAILWTALGIVGGSPGASAGWRRAADAVLALVAVTILAGGFVAGTRAGLTYNTFPLMDGRLLPGGYDQLQPFYLNWFENIAAVQFDHRALAIATATGIFVAGGARHLDLAAGRPDPARRGASGRSCAPADRRDLSPAHLAGSRRHGRASAGDHIVVGWCGRRRWQRTAHFRQRPSINGRSWRAPS